MKKILLFMLLTLLCAAALAEGTPPDSSDFRYTVLEDGSAQIDFYRATYISELTIPETLDGYPVTTISAQAFAYHPEITRVAIPDSVVSVAEAAFKGCSNLAEITISPDHPTLTVVDGALISLADGTLLCYPPAREAINYAVPEGVKAIGEYAFSNCKALESITLPASLESIGAMAFTNGRMLTAIHLPEGLQSIGPLAFSYCMALTEVYLPASVAEMGENPFRGCIRLRQIEVAPESPRFAILEGALVSLADGTLIAWPAGCDAEEYAVPAGVTAIGGSAFYACPTLQRVSIPQGVTVIGDDAFAECAALADVTLPEGLLTIGDMAFAASGLQSVSLPQSLTAIGSYAFAYLTGVESIVIPAAVTEIGTYAFCYSEGLTLVVPEDSCAAEWAETFGVPFLRQNANE